MTTEYRWDVSVTEATVIQKELRSQVKIQPLIKVPRTIAGADISYNRYSNDFYACFVVLSLQDLSEVEHSFAKYVATFPYVPGYLSFREIPALLKAYEKLKVKPDVIMADGHGIAHPRRLGIAAHLGLVLNVPTFGCGKSLLYGVADEPASEQGSVSHLHGKKADNEIIGALVRTKANVKPVFISPGNLITLQESISLAFLCTRGYRIPEPTRRAHNLVNMFRKGELEA